MRKIGFVVSALTLVSACALPPQSVSQQDIAKYEAAVASIGCDMAHESDYLPVELQTGLTREQVKDITKYQLAAGNAVALPEGGVRLTTGACA
ncbi:hypothetical protein ROA7450_02459 [Roseovarius albus]|uniref:NADH dehydrogenase subunit E n=1 Tax=Roseovarius albus TaxID=1247867 RepID=A0A1X6ZFY8_9RHOB|nr:hypothetical protein [Roseovarius albus]SLN49847.1 hypothetical protein ROA7450_02459 [Roseovarius albus]